MTADKRSTRRGGCYWIEGKPFISVTQIISVIDKPSLRFWFGKQVYLAMAKDPSLSQQEALAAPYKVSDKTKARGTTVHSIVESWKAGTFDIDGKVADEFKGYSQAFKEWAKDVNLKVYWTPKDTATHVQMLRDTVGVILDDVHELALKIRPPVLDDLGLLAALRDYLRDYRDRHCLFVDRQVLGLDEERLPAQIETAVYRIVQEALTNIVRHAQAEGVSVLVKKRGRALTLIVEDDGVGFDVDEVLGSGPDVRNPGLHGMREQALLLGGSLTIESGRSRGTSVFVNVPVVSGEDANGKDPRSGC